MKCKPVDHRHAAGACLRGVVRAPYSTLVKLFGEPDRTMTDYPKVQAEWVVKYEDGTVACIYDWCMKVRPEENTSWSVGGLSIRALWHVSDSIEEAHAKGL